MKEKDNKAIEVEFQNKFAEHNTLYGKACDNIRSLIKDFVAMRGGFYMFETYKPYVITEVYGGRHSFYEEARLYAIYIQNDDVYVYISACDSEYITKEDMLSEDVEESENWYLFDWDGGFVFEHAVNSIVCELMSLLQDCQI